MTRTVPQAAIDLVKQVESLRLTAYQDVAGIWTVGYGSTGDVLPGETITQGRAEMLLTLDLETAAKRLAGVVNDPIIQSLTDNQYSALLSFVFNLGANPGWTIWKVLNDRQFDQVPAQLIRFTYAGKPPVKVQGLVNRRTAEINLWSLDEPGSTDVSPSSSVTRTTATPAVPLDPKPKGLSLLVGAATTVVGGAIPQVQGAVQGVSDAITPYADKADILHHVLSLLAVVGAGLTVAALGFKYLKDRQAKSWSSSTAPALHPTALTSESNSNMAFSGAPLNNPPPGGTVVQPGDVQADHGAVQAAAPAPLVQNVRTLEVGGAGTTPPAKPTLSALTDLRDRIGALWTKVTGEVRTFVGKTAAEIIAEVDKVGADLDGKL